MNDILNRIIWASGDEATQDSLWSELALSKELIVVENMCCIMTTAKSERAKKYAFAVLLKLGKIPNDLFERLIFDLPQELGARLMQKWCDKELQRV